MPPGPWRRRCYIVYALGVLGMIILMIATLIILDWGSFYYRRTGNPDWHLFYVEPIWYWQIPLMFLVVNPLLILLGVRLVRHAAQRA